VASMARATAQSGAPQKALVKTTASFINERIVGRFISRCSEREG